MRLVNQAVRLALFMTLPTSALAQFGRIEFSDAGVFSEAAILSGVRASKAQCADVENAVWAQTRNGSAECLKFWKGGFGDGPVKRAIAFLHGDVFVGVGKTSPNYLGQNNAKLQTEAESWAKKLGQPYLFIARPGTYGSSGDHMQRRRLAESELVSAALDELKKRFGVEEWVVAGQSGGGHVTSSLLTERSDIVCAVPTSAPSSPRIRWEMKGRSRDTTNFADSYEPTKYLVKEKTNPALRVFVLGNPGDRNVFWRAQTVMADALKAVGIPADILEGEGTGPDAHGLANSARIVAGWCAQEVPTEEILARARKGLRG